MKTNIITKWAALLLTFSGLSLTAPLTVMAQFTDNTGTNVKAINGASGTAGGLNYHDTGNNGSVFYVTSSGTIWGLNGASLSQAGAAGGYGVYAQTGGVVILTGGSITTTATNARGVFTVSANTHVSLDGTDIMLANGVGLMATGSSTISARNLNLTVNGENGGGVLAQGSSITVNRANITTSDGAGLTAWNGGNITGSEVTIQASATSAQTRQTALVAFNSSTISLRDSSITALAEGQSVIHMQTDTWVAVLGDGASLIELIDTNMESRDGALIESRESNEHLANHYTGRNQIIISGGTLTAARELAKSSNDGNMEITISDATVSNGANLLTAGDNAQLAVNLNNTNVGGNITGSGSSNITISGSNGSTITGTATGKDDSNVNVNISGPGSSFVGDINKEDNGSIIVNINNGGSGTGGFNGGDLNVNGGDSSWNFDKDSHVNNGHNDGTLNIGGNDVKFDNLTNSGTIIINVNSDDQSHGTLDVTGTASGTGGISVNVTGSTATSNEDKDSILNDLLDHNAKDAWQFGPIEWGLEEDDVIVNPDGSVYVQPNGKLSTAGNIATGLIAAQKGSWFAQQNSLLKRMGEIRLLNDAYNQTLVGKDDKEVTLSAKNIIDNVWIRAYGQQLNYSASVTGQAFKQYVYGTDLGTDHKFTLNNSNVLYTGIFAGYGAADTDHRHNGSKSDISNYYAGLYGSWLNNSGWYADATLKAQYTNNTLNGSNGITSFNGSYHNWSVGGSIELGKQFKFQDDWFIEPQFQANYVHILASDYTLSQGLNVNVSDLDAFQLRLGVVAGKTLKLKNGGALQPYVKLSGVEMLSTGGKLNAMGNTVRPNLDGARAELGAGIIWQLDAHNQLHLDYEASFGDKYDKPWGLTAGYRYQF